MAARVGSLTIQITENIKTSRDDTGVLGGLPLGLAEVADGDGDDGNLDLCTEISLSSLGF